MKSNLWNRTKINSIVKPNLSKSNELLNERLFESAKNGSRQLNGHQLNTVVSNDLNGLLIINQPDNIDTTHSSNNQQLTDQELFGTNDIDKSMGVFNKDSLSIR